MMRLFQLIRYLFPVRCGQYRAWMRLNKPSTEPSPKAAAIQQSETPSAARIQQQNDDEDSKC
jgi:hypothetical protein